MLIIFFFPFFHIFRYKFDGQIFKGYLEGEGTITFPKSAKEQKRCLKISKSIFDLKSPDSIFGSFIRGNLVKGRKVQLFWENDNINISTCTRDGILHGKILVNYPQKWFYGTVLNGKIQNYVDCWIRNDNFLLNGKCNGIFEIDKLQNVTIFINNFITILNAKFKTGEIVYAHDFGKLNYELNLKSMERKFGKIPEKFCENYQNLDFEQLIQNYLKNIQLFEFSDEKFDEKKAPKLFTNIRKTSGNTYSATINLLKSENIKFEYYGNFDENEQFHGFAGLLIPENENIYEIQGDFKHGLLNGIVKILNKNDTQETLFYAKNGIIHGFVITYGTVAIFNNVIQVYDENGISLITKFENGKMNPNSWILKPFFTAPCTRQGFLYQTKNISAYIYPDFKTVLVGQFDDKIMISAQTAKITNAYCENEELKLEFSKPSGPIFKYDLSTTNSFGSLPLNPDPMENSLVYIAKSQQSNGGKYLDFC